MLALQLNRHLRRRVTTRRMPDIEQADFERAIETVDMYNDFVENVVTGRVVIPQVRVMKGMGNLFESTIGLGERCEER